MGSAINTGLSNTNQNALRMMNSSNYRSSFACPACNTEMETVYRINFVVKDKSLFSVSGGVKAVLFTADGICDKFFNGIPP